MKQIKFFLAVFAAMVGVGNAQAQTSWQGVSEITSGQEYYIVNDATGLFLTPGNNWGTRATLDESPAGTATVTLSDGKYTIIFTWPEHGNGLFVNTDDGSEVFCDRNNQANYFWAIESNGDKTFNVKLASDQARYNANSFLTAESSDVWANVQYNSGNESLRKWRFISPSEVKAAMLASEETLDVSLLVHGTQGTTNIAASNNSFDRFKSRYSWTIVGNGWKGQNNQTLAGFNKYWLEAWTGSALTNLSASKTVNSLPEGHYKISAYTIGGDGVEWFAQIGSGDKVTKTTAGGSPALTSVELDLTETSNITLGIQSNSTTTVGWIAFDNVKLEYTSFKKNYTDKLAEANALTTTLDGKIPAAALNALKNVITENTGKTSGYLEAAANLTTAMSTANALVVPYTRYTNIRTAILAINGSIDVSTANSQVEAATDAAGIETAVTTARAALASYLSTVSLGAGETIDLTAALIDNAAPGESGTTDYWTNSSNPGLQYNLWEFYNVHGATTKQTIATQLPAGNYKLTAVAFTRDGYEAKLVAGGNSTNIATVARETVNDRNKGNDWIAAGNGVTDLVFNLAEATSNLEIGLTANNSSNDDWMCWRSFRLIYGDVFDAYTLVEGKMSTAAAQAQAAADNTFKSTPTPENYMAVTAAITAAQVSKDAYAVAATAIADAKALQTNYNFVTPAAATTFAEAIAAIETPYNNGSLEDAAANNAGKTLGVVMVDWHAAATNTPASNYMISTWPSTYTINDWSWEGRDDGSNFLVPFFQDWVADGEKLTAKTMVGTLSGLDNGLYQVSAWVRVRATDGTAVADATGVTMNVNGGTAVDVTEGTQVGDTQFQLATYTAEGLVKDGNLTLTFTVADGTNVSWLAYRDVKYTKVRDLTDEEAAVVPTAIVLDETTVGLNESTKTKTFELTYTPDNASEGYLTWTSSDETVATVADGVVTAVSTGTATITVTSTLDAEVSATATVTVTFPESAVVNYLNSGATRTVYNLGPNLIKNGSFEYPDNFYGWTSGAGAKLTSSNFSIQTSGAYNGSNYLKASQDKGQADAGSIYTSWPVEAGKKYLFSYQMKNSTAVVNDGYIRTSLSATTSEEEASYNEMFKAVSCGTDWTTLSYEFTVPDGKNYLVFSARWLKSSKSFDNFYLCEILGDPTTEGNVDYATAAIPTANIGDGAFQYSQDAIDAANALVQGEAKVEDVEAAYNAVTTLNAPADGQVFNVMITTNDGYAFKENPLTFQADNASGAFFPQNTGVKAHRAQQITFSKVEGNKYKLSTVNALGQVVYIGTNQTINETGNTGQIRLTTDADKALAIQVVPTTAGVYNLLNTENSNNKLGCQDNPAEKDTGGLYTTNSHSDFTITVATKPSVNVAISADVIYGTRIFPFAPEKVAGVKYYSCGNVSGNTLTLTEVEGSLAANTPYILENISDADINETVSGFGCATSDSYTEGLLTGVYTATEAPAGTYVLQNNDSKVGFYQVAEGQEPTVGANRAYLTAPAQGGVKAFFFDDTATAIQNVFDGVAAGEVYDLAGRKLQKLQKGVNIVNGKKV
ncbi:MAG: carbohydrate binding domain-containing protein, partial [Bacteroidaceae bacterium]|nr:carbohydrate binding domain-containing protein [Bacteroidaceae bacterium]